MCCNNFNKSKEGDNSSRKCNDCRNNNLNMQSKQVQVQGQGERKKKIRQMMSVMIYGQLLSLANSFTGAASTMLVDECGVNSPTIQSSFMYFVLCFFLFFLSSPPPLAKEHENCDESLSIDNDNNDSVTQTKCITTTTTSNNKIKHNLTYLGIAFMDLEANYLTYLSYRYTSFTSITLIASLSIPSAMICSIILLKRKYKRNHFIGVFFCLVGLFITIFSDSSTVNADTDTNLSNNEQGPKEKEYGTAVLGDIVAIVGAITYGLNDTLCELTVKNRSVNEYLAMLGVFGVIISILQMSILERHEISQFISSYYHTKTARNELLDEYDEDNNIINQQCTFGKTILLLLINGISLSLYYMGAAYFLYFNEAALLDVSLLTTNLYAVLFVYWTHDTPPSFGGDEGTMSSENCFWLAFLFVILGVLIYETPTPEKEGGKEIKESLEMNKERNNNNNNNNNFKRSEDKPLLEYGSISNLSDDETNNLI